MTNLNIEPHSIIEKLSTVGDYELSRNKTKYEKLSKENETFLGILELEHRNIRADSFEVIDNPDSPKADKQIVRDKIKAKQIQIAQARIDKDAIKQVVNRIDKMLEEIVTKKNHEQILKYLKSQGITTLEQVKSALSKNH
jgi:hypothetical protein